MKKIKLTAYEKDIEKQALAGECSPVSVSKLREIEQSLAHRKKDYVMTIRVNSDDITRIKQKASRLGVKYQAFISEIIHTVAEQ